jgi:hypothetical protein
MLRQMQEHEDAMAAQAVASELQCAPWLGVLAACLRFASLHYQSPPASRSCQTFAVGHFDGRLRTWRHRGGSVLGWRASVRTC